MLYEHALYDARITLTTTHGCYLGTCHGLTEDGFVILLDAYRLGAETQPKTIYVNRAHVVAARKML